MVSRRGPAPRRPGLVFPTVLAAVVGGASILALSASGALALHGGPAAAVPLSAPLTGVLSSTPGMSVAEAGTASPPAVPARVASPPVGSPPPAATSRDVVPTEGAPPSAGAEPPVTVPTMTSDSESADGGSPEPGPVAVAGLDPDPTQAPTAAEHSISVSGGGFDDASPSPADRGELGSPRVVAAAGPTVSVIAEPSTGSGDASDG